MCAAAWLACCAALVCAGVPAAAQREFAFRADRYRVGLTRVARVQQLAGTDQVPYLVLTLYVEGEGARGLENVTELAQGARAWLPERPAGKRPRGTAAGGKGGRPGAARPGLALKQVREVPGEGSPARRWVEVAFAAPPREATELVKLAAAVVSFSAKQATAAEFTQLAAKAQEVRQGDVTVRLESAGWEPIGGEKARFQVELVARFPPSAPNAGRTEWLGDQVELVDRDGRSWTPEVRSGSTRTDARGEIREVRVLAYFSPLALRRGVGAIRYRAERIAGVRSFPYHFEGIPLP